jgi:hypothetical protein
VPRNTGHVSGFPREHTYVVPQKPDERIFLFRIQVGHDKGRLAGIIVDQLNLLMLVDLMCFRGAWRSRISNWPARVLEASTRVFSMRIEWSVASATLKLSSSQV